MSFGVDSCGFGHRPFGYGPLGIGPFVTFAETPGYSFTGDLSYAVAAYRFEDQSAQRSFRSRDRGQTLSYVFPQPDSGTDARVASWFAACGGSATRFIAWDHRTQTPQVVRFAGDALVRQRRSGMLRDLPSLDFTVERHVSYGEVVRATAPDNWWRLSEPIGATSIHDSGTGVFTVASLRPRVVQGCSFGAPGLREDDRTTAMACTSAVLVHSGGFFLLGDHSITALVQPLWPPRTFRPQPLYSLQASGGLVLSLQLNSFGYLQAVSSGGTVLATASVTTLLDNQPHQVAYGYFFGFGASILTIDQTAVVAAIGSPPLGIEVLSGGIASNPRSSHYFDGVIGDVTLYGSVFLTAEQLALPARVRARP